MKKLLIGKPWSEYSLDELRQLEYSQKTGILIFRVLFVIVLAITIFYWAKQDFSFDMSGVFNPFLYSCFGLLVTFLIMLGVTSPLKKIREMIKEREKE
jgi:hypothetical protein